VQFHRYAPGVGFNPPPPYGSTPLSCQRSIPFFVDLFLSAFFGRATSFLARTLPDIDGWRLRDALFLHQRCPTPIAPCLDHSVVDPAASTSEDLRPPSAPFPPRGFLFLPSPPYRGRPPLGTGLVRIPLLQVRLLLLLTHPSPLRPLLDDVLLFTLSGHLCRTCRLAALRQVFSFLLAWFFMNV